MVNTQRSPQVRSAFTLIELIFAITVIAIVVLSLPRITATTQQTMEQNLIQEAIYAAATELMAVTAGYWDENSMYDANTTHLSRVININSDCADTTKQRPGHVHRRCSDDLSIEPRNAAGGEFFDLDDANETTKSELFIDGTAEASGYKTIYKKQTIVTPDSDNKNIKDISVTIYDPQTDSVVTKLRMKSANIGEVDYYKRRL